MSKDNRPKAREIPSKKSASVVVALPNEENICPSWRLYFPEEEGYYSLGTIQKFHLIKIQQFLKSIESWSWLTLQKDRSGKCVKYQESSYAMLDKSLLNIFESVSSKAEGIYRFRIEGRMRLWFSRGIDEDCGYLVAWDPEHKGYPCER